MLKLSHISYTIHSTEILKNVSACFHPGEISVIIGPNGSGKSTLLKLACGEITPSNGYVEYDNIVLDKTKIEIAAKYRGILTQQSELNFPLTVKEVVSMGRYPHFISKPSKNDIDIVEAVLDKMQLQPFKKRNYLTLSGGEKQRVHFARILAQLWHKPENGVRYLLLDEPLSYLDLNYQHEFMKIAQEMAQGGDVVLAVLHDVNLAALYADKVFVLNHGSLIKEGKPAEVITSDLLFELYHTHINIVQIVNSSPHVFVPKS